MKNIKTQVTMNQTHMLIVYLCFLLASSFNSNQYPTRKCHHDIFSKNYNFLKTGSNKRKLGQENIFSSIRFHFDYQYTLPDEEKILREIIFPPVQEFFQMALMTRRIQGKLRFPSHIKKCQGLTLPKYLRQEGVDSDIAIIVSTFKGVQKYLYNDIKENTHKVENNDHEVNNKDNKFVHSMKMNLNEALKNHNSSYHNSTIVNNTDCNKTKPKEEWELIKPPQGIVGWASLCLQDYYTKRPIAGLIQFVSPIKLDLKNVEETIWTAIHELTHVLAFDYTLLNNFIKEDFTSYKINEIIKVKSSLKGFQELINQREKLMNSVEEFHSVIQSNSTTSTPPIINPANITNLPNSNSTVKSKNSKNPNNKYNDELYPNNSKINNDFITPQVGLIYEKNKDYESTNYNKNLLTKNKFLINKLKQFIFKETDFKFKSDSDDNNSTNITEYEKIKLEPMNEFIEINITENFNLETLMKSIENFNQYTRIFIKTPNVLRETKKYYGCDSAFGMELEHFGGVGSAFSHWSKRMLNTDYMIPDMYGDYYISNITLALFEDSGWYKVNYKVSQEMFWGKNKGCEFLETKCISQFTPGIQHSKIYDRTEPDLHLNKIDNKSSYDRIKNSINQLKSNKLKKITQNLRIQNSINSENVNTIKPLLYSSKFPEFCKTESDRNVCSQSFKFRGKCSLIKHSEKIPLNYQYFNKEYIGGISEFGDYCPYPNEWEEVIDEEYNFIGSCQIGKNKGEFHEKICQNCRCFQSNLQSKEEVIKKLEKFPKLEETYSSYNTNIKKASVCYQVFCRINENNYTFKNSKIRELPIKLTVLVGENEIECPYQGGTISSNLFFGSLDCPRTEEICVGDLNPMNGFEGNSSYYLFSSIKDKIINHLNSKNA